MSASPLSRADISQLTTALYKLKNNRNDIETLGRAGIDNSEFAQMNEFAIQRIEAILEVYGPAKG